VTDTGRQHRLQRMVGRDPAERHRAASPLELLFDLTFVAAFAQASGQTAHYIAEGHLATALGGFAFVAFAVCWAWINFSWFASAFDTDDWYFRVMTMIQMVGVIVLALGAPAVFESLDNGGALDNRVVVAGYIVMRLAVLALWARVAIQSPRFRRVAIGYIISIAITQVGWTVVAILELPLEPLLPLLVIVFAMEFAGPAISERIGGAPPWNAHHIAERFGLFTIITLGEVVIGTIAAVSAVVSRVGWSSDAIVVVVAGIGLAFGLWWVYFVVPAGDILERHRRRAKVWNYLHLPFFAAVAANGAGLHVAAYVVEGEASVGVLGAVISVAVPVFIAIVGYFALYLFLVRAFDPFHLLLFIGAAALLAGAVLLAAAGAGFSVCLILVMLSPVVIVVGYETVGHRHMAVVLERVLA
jgi:low temperature requirement protein LtrA